jgi:hypothetical protein
VDTPLENRARRSPGAANARAYSVRCCCLRFARFGTPTSANTNRALSVTQALTCDHETLIPVPVPSLGFQFPVQGTHTLFAAHRPPQHPHLQPCRRFRELNSVILPPVHETSSVVHETSDTDNSPSTRSNLRLDSLSCRIDERQQFESNPSHAAFAGELNVNAQCPTSEGSAIVETHSRFRANRDEANSWRLKRDRKHPASTSGLSNDRLGTLDDLQNGSCRAIPAAH